MRIHTICHLTAALALAGLSYVTSPANAAPLDQQCGYELRGTWLYRTSCDGAGTTDRSSGIRSTQSYTPRKIDDGCSSNGNGEKAQGRTAGNGHGHGDGGQGGLGSTQNGGK